MPPAPDEPPDGIPNCAELYRHRAPLPTPLPPSWQTPAVSPRERAVRRSTKQLQLIKGLNGVSERSWELATSINSSPCRAA